ncbi:class I SAM-dependent methyltransferase [Mycobacterium yunnanensis]|uniref:Class I SAM-dependent methyltransferase n=1 Tax=Mycobacterium yunnanensis TaxID=368477 RepID=A0A9X2YVT8_9MYCO|nr:class I SAM-dependent methyltransferase [Mycobacterium yunnanensis]MCV7419279.1 class I SAM-dependent methyltransferase [Mycobacterium yunnanensis]
MAEQAPVFTDRRRAESFGSVAEDYDRYRPRYPDALIARLVTAPGLRVLDVGAGTGISSAQLAGAGADVLAVEPDAQMAALCAAKGIPVERNTFEQWQPRDRTFDLVTFGQSFHWVDPDVALPKLARLLTPGGRLALMWNRITANDSVRRELERVSAQYGVTTPAATSGSNAETALQALLRRTEFTSERVEVREELHYSTEDWLSLVFTHSNHVVLEHAAKTELRGRLATLIGDDGVDAVNEALALICTRSNVTPASRG